MASPSVTIERAALSDADAVRLIAALDAEITERYPEEAANFFSLSEGEIAPGLSAFVLGEFTFAGGMRITPGFGALLVGIVLYTATFIAEIVRAGNGCAPTRPTLCEKRQLRGVAWVPRLLVSCQSRCLLSQRIASRVELNCEHSNVASIY